MTRSAPLAFHTGWVNTRPLMEKALALISEGAFNPRVIETAVVSFDQAVEALSEPFTKLVLTAESSR